MTSRFHPNLQQIEKSRIHIWNVATYPITIISDGKRTSKLGKERIRNSSPHTRPIYPNTHLSNQIRLHTTLLLKQTLCSSGIPPWTNSLSSAYFFTEWKVSLIQNG